MNRAVVVLAVFLSTAQALAQSFVTCQGNVEQNSASGRVFSSQLPDVFTSFADQDDFEHALSFDWNAMTSSEFRTDLSPDRAVNSAASVLEMDGWRLVSTPSRGFRLNGQEPISELCIDQDRIQVFANETATGVCLTARLQAETGRPCSSEFIGAGTPTDLEATDVRRYAPILLAPISQEQDFSVTRGGSALVAESSREATYSATISSDWSLEELFDFYEQQLEAQGWQRDAGWVVPAAGASAWSTQSASAGPVYGIFDIVRSGSQDFRAVFRAVLPQ